MRALGAGASLLAAIVGLSSGCAVFAPQPDPSRFFVLESVAREEHDPAGPRGAAIGVGPVRVPDYLGRLEMATRVGTTELRYTINERWAEPLDQGIKRVIGENLAKILGPRRIVSLPTVQRGRLRFEVPIEVVRFEPTPDDDVVLVARWALRDVREHRVVEGRESRVRVELRGATPEAKAEAMSRATLRLAEIIAARIAEAEGAP